MDDILLLKLITKGYPRCILTEFECKVDVQIHEFGWVCFQNLFFFKFIK